jgi:TfoX/Sxy family transcriptional regulator of competence genes
MTAVPPDIEAEVMRQYPRTKKEATCSYERMRKAYLRDKLREKLINERAAEAAIRRETPPKDHPL